MNAILDDASNETFLNDKVAGALGLKESYQAVKVHVLNNSVETFQTVPLKGVIESVNGQFTKEIEVKTCPRNVSGKYQVENWNSNKGKWRHLAQCDFASPAKDGLVDFSVDNADLHHSFVDVRGKAGEPVARLGPLGWTCIGPPDDRAETHTIRTLFTKDVGPVSVADGCCDLDGTLKRFWEIENYGTESCVLKKRDWPWTKLAAQFVTMVRDTVLPCHGKDKGLNFPIIVRWQNPIFSAQRKT